MLVLPTLLIKSILLSQVLALNPNAVTSNTSEPVLDMHVRLFNELLCRREPREPVAKSAIVAWAPTASGHVATHSELENILWAAVDNYDWGSASHLFKELATKTQNATVHYTAYKVLWRKLTANKLQYDPTNLLDFYATVRNVTNLVATSSQQLLELELEIRTELVARCAQLLEVPLHPPSFEGLSDVCKNESNYQLVRRTLTQLERLEEDIFVEVLNITFDAAASLEDKKNITQALNCLGVNANQQLIVHLLYLERNPDLYALLYNKIQKLVSLCDMTRLKPQHLIRILPFLPTSMEALHNASAVCIRNVTGPFGYLSECPQTSLMCTYSANYKYRSVYSVERLLGSKYILRSIYWQRYIMSENRNNGSSVPAFIKNIYSSGTPSVWQAVFVGNNVALMDPTMRQYLCGGNQTMWSSAEQHVYSRRAEDFLLYQHECLWLIEDCSSFM